MNIVEHTVIWIMASPWMAIRSLKGLDPLADRVKLWFLTNPEVLAEAHLFRAFLTHPHLRGTSCTERPVGADASR